VALYDHDLATYDASDTFRHQDAEGFVRLWGLGVATWSSRQGPGADGGTGSEPATHSSDL
jgi:argininosuccinate synthase